jgi:hypothetical protein
MSPEKRNDAPLDALRFLMTSSTPAQHKKVLIDVVVEAMRADETTQRDLVVKEQEQADTPWFPHEVETVREHLQGRVARSWQEGDELLMGLAAKLKRVHTNVRSKALELNLGAAIDYRLAKAQARSNSSS